MHKGHAQGSARAKALQWHAQGSARPCSGVRKEVLRPCSGTAPGRVELHHRQGIALPPPPATRQGEHRAARCPRRVLGGSKVRIINQIELKCVVMCRVVACVGRGGMEGAFWLAYDGGVKVAHGQRQRRRRRHVIVVVVVVGRLTTTANPLSQPRRQRQAHPPTPAHGRRCVSCTAAARAADRPAASIWSCWGALYVAWPPPEGLLAYSCSRDYP